MELIVKNMVCDRCLESVTHIFRDAEVSVRSVALGRVVTESFLDESTLIRIGASLSDKGFELIRDREQETVEAIRQRVRAYVKHVEESEQPQKLSSFIRLHLHYNYSYLSHLFSKKTGDTIEGYLIKLKIERVKELLGYKRYTLSEIAWRLKYSSVQYLSNQFKKVTGITVSKYLKMTVQERTSLDRV